jgi:hypothetical protein
MHIVEVEYVVRDRQASNAMKACRRERKTNANYIWYRGEREAGVERDEEPVVVKGRQIPITCTVGEQDCAESTLSRWCGERWAGLECDESVS